MNQANHKQVRAWLESEHALDSQTEAALQAHLHTCPDCRAYAEMITQLKEGSWNPFPRQTLTQTESQKIASQIRPHLRRNKMSQKVSSFNLSSALGLVGLLAIVALFALMIAQLNQTAVAPAAPSTQSEAANYTWYDGWEAGVAFQFPASWTITEIDSDDSSILLFATPLNETAAPCTPFLASDANAAAWIVPFDETMPLTPLEFLTLFIESDELIYLEEAQPVAVNGRAAAYSLAEVPCEAPFNQITMMATETETHHVLFGLRHGPDSANAAKTELETMVASLADVDYTGWQPWRPGQFIYTVMAPTGWNVFDGGKSLEVTPNNQPAWSSIADPNDLANAPRLILFHNLNSQFGETPQVMVERYITQFETDLAMQQVDPPTAHPIVPGLVTAVYTTEDTAVFFGAIPYPRGTGQLDPIGATATVPLDQLDSFRPTFARILRSLNGYYYNLPDTAVQEALTGGIIPNATPTATPKP